MKKLLVTLACFLISCPFFAQTSDFISKMISTDKVTFGQVCYVAAAGQSLVTPEASETDAINALYEDAVTSSKNPDSSVNYAEAASIFAKVYNVKGGLFFTLTQKNPRYSFKQLKIDGVIAEGTNPYAGLSGTQLLTLFTNCELKYNPEANKPFVEEENPEPAADTGIAESKGDLE